jgi:uncharacterized protein
MVVDQKDSQCDLEATEKMGNYVTTAEQIRARLREYKTSGVNEYQPTALGYFGSFARGEATEESDIDIVFDTSAPNLFRAVMLREDLEELLGRPVDLVQLNGLNNPRMKARIEREAIYV